MCRERKIIVFLVRDVALWESAYVTCIGPWVRFTSTAKINRNIVPFSYLFVLFKDLFSIIICKYTVAVFRHTRRECQISLQVVVSHLVVAGI